MDQVAYINGCAYSYNSCIFRANGIALVGVRGFDFEESRPRTLVKGSVRNGVPLAMTAGSYECPPATLTVLRNSEDAFTDILMATPTSLGSIGDAEFVLMVQVLEPLSTAKPQLTVLNGCVITNIKRPHQIGDEPLTTEFQIQPLTAIVNGKPLYSVARAVTL